MTEHYLASTVNEAESYPRREPDELKPIRMAEENSDLAPTSENFSTVTKTTLPHGSGIEQNKTKWRDSLSEPGQLPEEIFIEIIRHAACNPRIDQRTNVLSDPTRFHFLNDYRAVCKRWKTAIDGTPTLWAFLCADLISLEALSLQKAIEKSGDAPLVISYGDGWMGLPHFVEMVTPQMHRCKALWFKTTHQDHPSTLRPLFAKPCPLLEEFHFDSGRWWTASVDGADSNTRQDSSGFTYLEVWALRHNAERVKALSLGLVRGWTTGSKLTNLRELKLRCPLMTLQKLIESLTESPLLRTLAIENPYKVWYQNLECVSIVELAFLIRIKLENVSASFTHALLSHINPPSLEQLVISISYFDTPLSPLEDVGAGYQALLLSVMKAQGPEPIPIEIGVRFQQLFVADNHTCRAFDLLGDETWPSGFPIHFVQSLSNLSRCWSSMSTPSFALLIGTTNPDPRDGPFHVTQECLGPLMDIEGVREIQLGRMVLDVQLIYERLSYAVVGEDQSRRWPLSRLTTLVIEGHEGQDEALVQMLERRHAAAVTVDGDTVAPLPFSLVKLVRHSGETTKPEILDQIKNIIGEEHFRVEIEEE